MRRSRGKFFKIALPLVFFGSLALFWQFQPAVLVREAAVSTMARPVQFAKSGGWRVQSAFEALFIESAGRRRPEKYKLAALEAEIAGLRIENDSLRKALGLKNSGQEAFLPARVILYNQEGGYESLMIEAGKGEGVLKGDLVVDEERLLIGEVIESGERFSKVAVASNPEMTFTSRLHPLGGSALAKGIGGRGFRLELIPESAELRVGDFALWTDERRRGLPLIFAGRVARIEAGGSGSPFKTASAVLLSRPEFTEQVFVLRNNP